MAAVELAVGAVAGVVDAGRLGARGDRLAERDEARDVAPAGERPDADAGGEGRAERRARVIDDRLEHESGDVGDDLLPQHRRRAAVRDPRPRRPHAMLGEHLQVVPDAVGEALEHGPEEVPAAVAESQAGECPGRERVVDRRLLAEQVREHHDAVRARRCCRRLGVEDVQPGAAGELALEPAHARTPARHAAVGQPEAGGGVGVEVEAGVEQRAIAAREHVDGSAELDEQVAVARQAGGEGRGDVVGETRDHRDALAQAGPRRDVRAHAADHLARIADRAERAASQRPPPRTDRARRRRCEVVEAALERPVALAVGGAGERAGEPVVRAGHPRGAGPQLGFVALQPAQLGPDRLHGDARARAAQHLAGVELGGQLVDLRVRACVVVEERRPQRLAVRSEQQDARHAARRRRRR